MTATLTVPIDHPMSMPSPPTVPNVAASRAGRAGSPISAALASFDWSFASRARASPIDSLHPYPAKFISELPGAILDIVQPARGTLVFDPFCGSGTTLTAAQQRGLPSLGVDLNPIACLISRVRTAPLPADVLYEVDAVLDEARSRGAAAVPDIPNLDHWFKPEVQVATAALVEAIGRRTASAAFDSLRLALSSILVRISNQESDTRYAAIDKGTTADDVFSLFRGASSRLVAALQARDWELTPATVIESDIQKLSPKMIGGRVGVVITSPPYPNAYEYWLYHKYRMWWLGFDPLSVKASEIGARAHFFKRDHHTAEHFREQMRRVFSIISGVLAPGAWVCFVVGRSKIHGEYIDNAKTVAEVGAEVGLRLEKRIERVIAPNRKSFNLSHASIKSESIVVLRKN